MCELRVYKKSNALMATFIDEEGDVKAVLDENQVYEIISEVKKSNLNVNKICFNGNNLLIKCGAIKLTLVNQMRFRHDREFGFIFKAIKLKKYKLMVKKSILPGALLATMLIALPSHVNSQSYEDKKTDSEEIISSVMDDNDPVCFEPFNGNVNNVKDDSGSMSNNLNENLAYGSLVGKGKYNKTKELYGDIIEYYAGVYGVDPAIILAIATQERGVHSSEVDEGGAIGLMQIQVSVWDGKSISAHNYETDQDEVIEISLDKLKDVRFNIKVGCAIFQNYLNQMNGNVIAAIQSYNMGPSSVRKIITSYANKVEKTYFQVLNDQSDTNWLSERNSSYPGDPNYVENVSRYYEPEAQKQSVK